jgi:hypothetical protein
MVRIACGLAIVTACVGAASAQPAQPLYRVTRDTYGCANPRATAALTNPQEPRRGDPGWVNFVITDGHCAPITPRSQWRLVFREGNLAYMTYAGTTGLPGSFYLSSDELVEIGTPPPSATPSQLRAPEELNRPPAGPFQLPSANAAPPSGPSMPPPSNTSISPTVVPATGLTATGQTLSETMSGGPKTPQPAGSTFPSTGPRSPETPVTAAAPPLPSQPASSNTVIGTSGGRPAPAAPQQNPSVGAGLAVLAAAATAFWLFTRKRRIATARRRDEPKRSAPPTAPIPAPQPQKTTARHSAPVIPTASAPLSRKVPAPAPAARVHPATWYAQGKSVTVAGHVIGDGMVYVGGPLGSVRSAVLHRSRVRGGPL